MNWLETIITKLKISLKNRHRMITLGYAAAIASAFVLSLTNNNDVSASVAPRERLDYIMFENNIASNLQNQESIYPQSSIENIKSLFEMVNYNSQSKIIENEIVVSKGDSFISILNNLGLDYNGAHELYTILKKVYNPQNLKIGQKIVVTTVNRTQIDLPESPVSDSGVSVESIVIEGKPGERYILEKDENQQYTARAEKDELITEVNSASGSINGTLSSAMTAQNVPSKIVSEFINIFAFSVDFRRDVRKGDKFEIIYENHITPDGEVVRSGNILYAALQLRKDKIALYRFKDKSGNVDYYNEKGLAMKKTLSRKPMSFQNARISSPFGKRRHPILRDIRIHWGVDYAAPAGTLVYAGGDGVIQVAKYNGGYGNYIKIRHNSEYSTAYGHMKAFAKGIRPGVRVKQGQVIGYVGSTGRSTGPHLHYEVIRNGRRVNPTTIKAAAGENLKGSSLKEFKTVVAGIKDSYQKMFAQEQPAKMASR